MIDRRVNRPANNRRERRGFRQRQLPHRLAEIIFRRCFEPVISRPQINLVAVHRENLFFGVMPLDLNRQNRFLNLSPRAAVRTIQKKSAGKLHRQSAGALRQAMVPMSCHAASQHARNVHAPVFFEVLVFGSEDRVLQNFRNLPVSKQNPPLQRKRADGLPIVRVQLGHHVRPVILQRMNFRQIARIYEQQPNRRAQPPPRTAPENVNANRPNTVSPVIFIVAR